MAKSPVSDRTITCPHCFADNTLIGSDLPDGAEIYCSNCGEDIGAASDMRDSHIDSEPARTTFDNHASQTDG